MTGTSPLHQGNSSNPPTTKMGRSASTWATQGTHTARHCRYSQDHTRAAAKTAAEPTNTIGHALWPANARVWCTVKHAADATIAPRMPRAESPRIRIHWRKTNHRQTTSSTGEFPSTQKPAANRWRAGVAMLRSAMARTCTASTQPWPNAKCAASIAAAMIAPVTHPTPRPRAVARHQLQLPFSATNHHAAGKATSHSVEKANRARPTSAGTIQKVKTTARDGTGTSKPGARNPLLTSLPISTL